MSAEAPRRAHASPARATIARQIAIWLCIALVLCVVAAYALLTTGWGPLATWSGTLLVVTGLGIAALDGVARMDVEGADVPNASARRRR